jgi:hypothetical protein
MKVIFLFHLSSDHFISCHGLGPVICADSELKGPSNVLLPSWPENENPAKPFVGGIKDK